MVRAGSLLAFGLLPALLVLGLILQAASQGGFDFQVFWEAARDVLRGDSPYPPVDPAVLRTEHEFVYPAPAAWAVAPFAWLPYSVAAPLFISLMTVAAVAALWLCDVRDWRCYGLAALTPPLGSAIGLGTVTPLLFLGVAALWRYRNRVVTAGLVTAALILLKVFLWPLVIWLLATRRALSAAVAAAAAGVVVTASWAALGFEGALEYPRLVATLSDVLQGKGYSATALGLAAGLPAGAARGLALAVGVGGLVALFFAGRRRKPEWMLFVTAIGVALVLSPIVWSHYFVLLLVPLAVVQPRLGWLWGVFILFWLIPGQSALPPIWEGASVAPADLPLTPRVGELYLILIGITIAGLILVVTARARADA